MIKNHLIIFFPLVDWDAPWQRYQYLAKTFSKHNKVIYFEPALSLRYFLKKPRLLCRKLLRSLRVKKQVAENLYILDAPPIFPFGNRIHFINQINQFLIVLLIKFSTINFKEGKNLCLWISDAIHYPLIKLMKPKISVYDNTDAIIFRDAKKQKFHTTLRHRTIKDSSVSFFTSQLYFKEGKAYSYNCHYIPNGVDINNFRKRHYPVPKEMKKIKRPILGFVGTLDLRIDRQLIKEIVIKRPHVSLVFVGPTIDNFLKFRNEERLFFLGKKEYKDIPNYINQFDVALIPYRLFENTKFMYPVKLHEYLILGKPVVSTNLLEVRQFSEVIYIAKNSQEFIAKIDEALREKGEGRRKRWVQTALANTWDHRLAKMQRELERVNERNSQDGIGSNEIIF